jgi:hypothetical protein
MHYPHNGPASSLPELAAPRSARRVLALGIYDGATAGVLEADTGEVFRFDLPDEDVQLGKLGPRTYSLRLLPADAFRQLIAIIGPHFPPKWPAWYPVWQFPDDSTRVQVEAQTDMVLAEAGPVLWEITTDDYWEFAHFVATRPVTRPAVHE